MRNYPRLIKFSPVMLLLPLVYGLLLSCNLTSLNLLSTPTPTQTPTPLPTATLTPLPTVTPTLTATLRPTATATPTIPLTPTLQANWTTFETDTIALAYPKIWKVENRTHDERCIPGVIDCLLRILAPGDANTQLTLVMMDFSVFGEDVSVEKMDESLWEIEPMAFQELGLEDPVNLESKTSLQVGRASAVRRIFSEPLLKNKRVIGRLYVERLLIIYQRKSFHFYLNTTNESKFEGYQELMGQIIATFVFR
jgi:hypothetical protein